MDSHNLEPHEYNERVRLYAQRLQQQWNNIKHPSNSPTGLLIILLNSLIPLLSFCSFI